MTTNPPDSVPTPKGVGPVNPKELTVPQDAVLEAKAILHGIGPPSREQMKCVAKAVLDMQERIDKLERLLKLNRQINDQAIADADEAEAEVATLRTALETRTPQPTTKP